MYSEENKSSALAKQLSVYDYVFVDTCSLMEDGFASFMDVLAASHEYWKEGLRVIVPAECVAELKKHSKSKDNQEARIEAKRALKILHHDKWHGRILEIGKAINNNDFADNAIYTQVSSLRIRNKVLIITQDKTLAGDLRNLNTLDSQHGRFLDVLRINADGSLSENNGEPGYYHQKENAEKYNSRNSRYDNHHGFFSRNRRETRPVTKDEEKPIYNKDKEVKTFAHPDIIEGDKRLCANLSNGNYPLDKKVSDLDAQIKALSALSDAERNQLSLAYTLDQLKSEKLKLDKPLEKKVVVTPAPQVAVLEAKKPIAPVPMEVHMPPKEVKKEAPKVMAPKGRYEFGRTVEEACLKCGTHVGLIFRDESVPYIKQIHGPVNVTNQDLAKMASGMKFSKTGDVQEAKIGQLLIYAEKTDRDYKVILSLEPQAVVAPAKAVITPVTTPKVATPVVAPHKTTSNVTKTPRKKAIAPKKAVTPLPQKTVTILTPDNSTAVPLGATLIVGMPSDERKRSYLERKSRREDNADLHTAKPDHVEKKSQPKKVASKPVAKKVEHQPKKKVVAVKTPTHTSLADVLASEKRLNANINNNTYPLAQKLKDLKKQEMLLKGLTPEEKKQVKYNEKFLSNKIKELSK